MSLEEIYHEFWEFIDDDNVEFRHFIELDNRRKKNEIKFLWNGASSMLNHVKFGEELTLTLFYFKNSINRG